MEPQSKISIHAQVFEASSYILRMLRFVVRKWIVRQSQVIELHVSDEAFLFNTVSSSRFNCLQGLCISS